MSCAVITLSQVITPTLLHPPSHHWPLNSTLHTLYICMYRCRMKILTSTYTEFRVWSGTNFPLQSTYALYILQCQLVIRGKSDLLCFTALQSPFSLDCRNPLKKDLSRLVYWVLKLIVELSIFSGPEFGWKLSRGFDKWSLFFFLKEKFHNG